MSHFAWFAAILFQSRNGETLTCLWVAASGRNQKSAKPIQVPQNGAAKGDKVAKTRSSPFKLG
jgi:hypothetical protein